MFPFMILCFHTVIEICQYQTYLLSSQESRQYLHYTFNNEKTIADVAEITYFFYNAIKNALNVFIKHNVMFVIH